MDHVVVECPQCHAQGTMDGTVVGKPAKCPKCSTTFMVQASQVKAAPPPPPPPAEEPAPPPPASADSPTHPAPVMAATPQPAWKKPWVIALAVLGLIIFISVCASDHNKATGGTSAGGGNTSAASGRAAAADGSVQTSAGGDAAVVPAQSGGATEPFEQYRTAAKQATYDDLARNADSLKGTKVRFTGKVIQVVSDEGGKEDLRVQMTRGEDGWENEVHVTYARGENGPRVLEDDVVAVWGTVLGLATFDRAVGGQATVPSVEAAYVTFPTKPLVLEVKKSVTVAPWQYTIAKVTKTSVFDEHGQLVVGKANYEVRFTVAQSTDRVLDCPEIRCDLVTPDGKAVKGSVLNEGTPMNPEARNLLVHGDKYAWDMTASFEEAGDFPSWPAFRVYGGAKPTAEMNRAHSENGNWDYVPVDESSFTDVKVGQ